MLRERSRSFCPARHGADFRWENPSAGDFWWFDPHVDLYVTCVSLLYIYTYIHTAYSIYAVYCDMYMYIQLLYGYIKSAAVWPLGIRGSFPKMEQKMRTNLLGTVARTCSSRQHRASLLSVAACDRMKTRPRSSKIYSFPFPPLQLSTVLEHLSLKCPVPTVPKSHWDGADPGESLARSRHQSFLPDVTSHQSPLSGLTCPHLTGSY